MISEENLKSCHQKSIFWRETKFVRRDGHWIANPDAVNASSRLAANLMLSAYVRVLQQYARGTLADLGCGDAPLFGIYKEQASHALWVDWGESLHCQIEKDLITDLNERLPIDSDLFDTIVLSDVLEHIRYPEELIREIGRIMKPGGVLLAGVPFMYWLHERPHDYSRYTSFKLTSMAEDAGLQVLEILETGGGWDIIHDVMMKILFGKRYYYIASTVYKLYFFLRGTIVFKRGINKWKSRFPLGYVFVVRKPLS